MRSRWRRNTVLGLACALSFGLGLAVTAALRRTAPRLVRSVASVNGEELSEDDLKIALTAYRRVAIGDLVTQRLVEQEARKRGITASADADKMELPDGLLADERLAVERQAAADLLRKKVILAGFTAPQKQQFFESLAPDLAEYSLLVMTLQTSEDYPLLRREMESGASFESLIPKYSLKLPLPEEKGLSRSTRATISKYLGPYVAEAASLMKVGATSDILPSPFGPTVIHLTEARRDFKSLEGALDEVLFQSEALAFDDQLGRDAFVASELAPELAKKPNKARAKALAMADLQALSAKKPFSLPRDKVTPLKELRGPRLWQKTATPPPPPKQLPKKIRIGGEAPSLPEIFRARVIRRRHRLLGQVSGRQQVLRLDLNDNLHADAGEPVLVKVTLKGWEPVPQLTSSVTRFSMENDYGYWSDRSPGRSGVVEADEVRLNILQPLPGNDHRYQLGVEILCDDQGRLFQLEQIAEYPAGMTVSAEDLARMDDYRSVSANWTVNSP